MKSLVHCTVLLFAASVLSCAGSRPADIGIRNGRLSPCPASPNCVSSQASDNRHYIAPLRYGETAQEAKYRLLGVLKAMKRAKIVTDNGDYIHAEFTSAIFRFIDDTEFLFDDTAKIIQMRSAARVGYYDFGVNRRRLEAVRAEFTGKK
jgi:uncharacterized protein (DUF1499 family)